MGDIENGVKLRDISSFALAPSINTADYLATLLTNAASAVRHLAGFYGHVNDFNPGDWIVNRTREVTMMCFATVTTYYETTGNKYTCNENLVQGDILAVPLCDAQGLLDEEGYTATYPERIWREIPTPRFNFEVTGPGRCNVSTDCPGNYFCGLSEGKCQMCITDYHCARLGTPEFPAECVANNAFRLCEFDIDTDLPDPTPGAPRPEGLVNCQPRCQGQYCSNGGCVDCRDFNDCGLLFSLLSLVSSSLSSATVLPRLPSRPSSTRPRTPSPCSAPLLSTRARPPWAPTLLQPRSKCVMPKPWHKPWPKPWPNHRLALSLSLSLLQVNF